MNTFVDYAIQEHGVKRFVLMGGTSSEPGGQHVGKVWSHLLERGVDYCVLRPTWFMGKSNRAHQPLSYLHLLFSPFQPQVADLRTRS